MYSQMALHRPLDADAQRAMAAIEMDIGLVLWEHGDPSHPLSLTLILSAAISALYQKKAGQFFTGPLGIN
jgi:hypothetical protein